jgi:hypothetical protein
MNMGRGFGITVILILAGIILASCSAPDPLEIDLIAYWPLDGDAKDASGNGHDGTVHGATLTTDQNEEDGKAYSFDGVNDYISITDSPDFDIGVGDMTVLLWALLEPGPEFRGVISHTNGEEANDGWWLTMAIFPEGTGGWVCMDDLDHVQEMDLSMDTWTHLAFVKSGSEITYYVDGTIQGDPHDNEKTINDSDGDLRIGLEGSTYGEGFFVGKIDDVRFYNRALTTDEILSAMSAQ